MIASPTNMRSESTVNATPNRTRVMSMDALVGEALVPGTTWTGTGKACTTSSPRTALIAASDAGAATVPSGTRSGLVWTTSDLTVPACTRPRTSTSSSNSQQFARPHAQSRDADDVPRSEVEPAKISDPDPDHDHDHLRPVRNGPPPPARHVTKTARADTQRPTKAPSNSPFLPQGSGWSGRVQSGQSAAYHSLDDHEKQGQGTQGTCDSSPIMYDQEGLGQQDQHLLQQARLQPGPIGSRPDHHGRNPAAGIVRSLESKAEELSRAIASDLGSDLGSMNLKQTTPHDLQSAIYAKVLSHLDLGLSTKRSSGDASLDEAGPPRAKRVICRSCSKTMERPCDLK